VTNPYRPPEAVVKDQDRPRGSPLKAVSFGVLTDILGTTAASVLISLIYGIVLAAGGASAEEITQAAAHVDPGSALSIFGFVIGTGFSFLGGYVCARVAGRQELQWASVVAVISIGIGFLVGMQVYTAELNVLLAILGIGAVMAGGYAGARQNLKG
jgi:uncharacterized membrane protein